MHKRGALVLLAAIAGCSSGITGPDDMSAASDLSAAAGDMTSACTFVFAGDASVTMSCRPFLCHPTGNDVNYDALDLAGPEPNTYYAHAIFNVDGMLALRSYTGSDFSQIDVGFTANNVHYGVQPALGSVQPALGSATLTIEAVTRPSALPCDGAAHGSAHASLVELVDGDGGGLVAGAGRVTLDATF